MHPAFCTACGAPTEPDDRFCTNCGHAFAEDVPPPPAPAPPPPPAAPPAPARPAPTAPTQAAAAAPAHDGRRRTMVIIGVLAALLLVVGAVAVFALTRGDDTDEVVLEPAAVDVPDPFTSPVAIDERPLAAAGATTSTSTSGSSSSQATTAAPATGAAGGQVVGSAPGLYGGTRDAGSCDPDKLVAFLQGDTAKAKAWAEVQGIAPAEIPTFVRSLTPVVLRRDTRVLNHGYRNGSATPRPAVLQAGTAVLVDSYGIPRVKCGCGNPLGVAEPLTTGTTYSGKRWSGFDPAKVVVVRQDVKVETFVLVDVRTGDPFRRPTASKGDDDAEATPGSLSTTTTAPATTTEVPTTAERSTTTGPSEGTSAPKLFSIESIAGVSNNPTVPSVAELPAARITAIFTYHWNNATGATPGTISLKSSTGKVYGPFQTTGSPGQGGVPNANWTAITNFTVPAGTYTVVDSSPETWAWAPDTGGRGMVIIYGVAT